MRRIQSGLGSAPAPDARAGFRQAGHGDGSAPYVSRVSIDEAKRRENVNPDNEDNILMGNGSAPRETTWKGLVSNDIYYIWNHGPKFGGGFVCRYCPLITRGGGATRFREHLGGIPGDVRECPNVPRNICAAMRESRDDSMRKKREVPNLQKCALRIVSQCVSSSGCERNWSAFALVHTKQRNRLLYGKLHKLVSVRYNLKIRAEEEEDPVRENDKQKEVDACAMMMDTTMFDATNPMMEWLNEDEEHAILDGVDAASVVFEKIRLLNSSRKVSRLARKDNGRKRKRVEEEEDDYHDSEDDDEENEELDLEIDDDDDSHDDGASQSDGGDAPMQVEKDLTSQVGNNVEVTSDGSLVNRRSERVRQAKKVKEVTSLYN
ncbi:uncharacterized protein [Triticum aestivum]|uniref:uncharacterized protein isoform X1 n=2 Tax=Triticum aestivum TaxID=4565 RepID=UPI001D015914|nr:uncharacterized protein LOC123145704 isoform X1 [Triticum aestivum]